MYLYCDYNCLIPLISPMIGNKPSHTLSGASCLEFLHVQDEASVKKIEGSDYREIKYMVISASASTPSLIC